MSDPRTGKWITPRLRAVSRQCRERFYPEQAPPVRRHEPDRPTHRACSHTQPRAGGSRRGVKSPRRVCARAARAAGVLASIDLVSKTALAACGKSPAARLRWIPVYISVVALAVIPEERTVLWPAPSHPGHETPPGWARRGLEAFPRRVRRCHDRVLVRCRR